MKKLAALALILCLTLSLTFPAMAETQETTDPSQESTSPFGDPTPPTFTGSISAVDDASITSGCQTLNGRVPLLGTSEYLSDTESAFLYERNTGTVVYAWNPDVPLAPASLVKIMTALLVIENGNLDQATTVSQSALDTITEVASSVDLQTGEVLSVRDLLYCMMVHSANDAAAVLAEAVSGSQEAFVARMNQKAKDLGCTGTVFMNAHGLHHEEQLTTARDTAKIVAAAMENELFRDVFGTTSYTVPATNLHEERELITNNYLMSKWVMEQYYDDRVTGGRAGSMNDGRLNLAATAQSGGLDYIIVVLGATTTLDDSGKVSQYGNFEQVRKLMKLGFNGLSPYQILYDGQSIKQYPVTGGANDLVAGADRSVSALLPTGMTSDKLTWRMQDVSAALTAPVEKGTLVSLLQVWYGSVCIAQSNVLALHTVKTAASGSDQLTGGDQTSDGLMKGLIVLGILLAAILLLIAAMMAARFVQTARMRAKSRRRRRNRRRSR